MSSERSVDHYAAVLADLEAKKAQIEAAIATIKALKGGGQLPPSIKASVDTQSAVAGDVIELEIDAFHKLTTAQSIRKYLGMRNRRPATTQEIVEALTAGGQANADGPNFAVVVSNSLKRLAADDGVATKVKRGVWGLKEWYQNKSKTDE